MKTLLLAIIDCRLSSSVSALKLASVLALVLAPATLQAQTMTHVIEAPGLPPRTGHPLGRHLEIVVDDTGTGPAAGVYELPVDPAGHAMVYYPDDIERATGLPSPYFTVEVSAQRAAIYASGRRLKPGARRTVTLASESAALTFEIRPAVTQGEAVSLVTVRKRSEKEAWEAALAEQRRALEQATHALEDEKHALAQVRQDLTTQQRALAAQQRQLAQDAAETMDVRAKNLLLHDRRLETTLVETGRDDDLARVSLGHGRWFDDDTFYFPMKLHYRGTKPFRAERIEVVDAAGRAIDATLIGMAPPAPARDGIIAVLEPGEHTTGVIKLSRMAKSNLTGLTIRLVEATGLPAILVMTQPWEISPPYRQVFPEEREARERERRRRELDERERGKVSLHLQGVYGAIWLGDGTGADLSDVTSMTGLGMRAQYAFNRYWAVEGEVLGARTGSARFDDVMYDGMQGDLARSGSLGRVQIGGVLRLGGERYVPLARLGFGGQGGSHTAVFNGMDGPDLPFDFSALWYGGAGLDIRLGDHFLAGIALTIENMVSSANDLSHSTVEAGLHLGYAWKP